MASLRMLTDTVRLYNYIGEVDNEAVYQETLLTHCYCPLNEGADLNVLGRKGKDSAKLYIFYSRTIALSADGNEVVRRYLPYQEWKELEDKSQYWTISDKGGDYFRKVENGTLSSKLRVVSFARKQAGSRRMWHFEVTGQ